MADDPVNGCPPARMSLVEKRKLPTSEVTSPALPRMASATVCQNQLTGSNGTGISSSSLGPESLARQRAFEDVSEGGRHLDADGADDDPLDPELGLGHGGRLDRRHLPEEGENERQRADRPDQGAGVRSRL